MSDTGIKHSGDTAKALVFGSDTVMMGGLFSGTEECPGDVIIKKGKKFKYSYGMCTDESIIRDQKKQKLSKTIVKKGFKKRAKQLLGYSTQTKESIFQENLLQNLLITI